VTDVKMVEGPAAEECVWRAPYWMLVTSSRSGCSPSELTARESSLAGEGGLACAADQAGPGGRSGGQDDLSPGL